MTKPILVLDFDGVIHSYTSGWKGAAVIPDPPVPGALEFIVGALDRFEVHILSSRSHQRGGRNAMKRWLRDALMYQGGCNPQGGQFDFQIPEWWSDFIAEHSAMEPWPHEARNSANLVVKTIKWPTRKPAALFTIDDRAHQFTGDWPTFDAIANFKPWNKRSTAPNPNAPGAAGEFGP
jgi:hypothetical protein